VLIGPVRTGKSTLGKLLAERLGVLQVSLDEERLRYYKEIGYDDRLAQEIRSRGGFLALVLYWNLFDAHAVERLLSEHHDCLFDFGGGIYWNDEVLSRVQRTLQPYRNVVLILPSPDVEESVRLLRERDQNPPGDLNFDFNTYFIKHPSYSTLARFVVYTAGKTPNETCDEILELVAL
jgi:shikimate kinase